MTARSTRPARPNVLVLVVDQLGLPPAAYGEAGGVDPALRAMLGFEEGHDGGRFARFFPGLRALRRHAVVLRQHAIGAAACTPSRAVMFTGCHATQTSVSQTGGLGKRDDEGPFPWLDPAGVPTLGDWFRAAGHSTHWFGKWHLSHPRGGDLEPWGFADGERSHPEPHGADPRNLGVYRDRGFADDTIAFLRSRGGLRGGGQQPWLAVASLVNPHDVSGFPAPWWPGVEPLGWPTRPPPIPRRGARSLPLARGRAIELNPDGFPEDCYEPPPTLDEDLASKPRCHREAAWKVGLALRARWPAPARPLCPLPFQLQADPRAWFRAYGRFHAYLCHLVDREIARILAALDESGARERTIVVFTSDHGDHLGAHGGMIHKWHTAYEEIVRVPFVISSPLVNADGQAMRGIDAPTSHADLVPTLLGLVGVDARERERLAAAMKEQRPARLGGADLSALARGEASAVTEVDGAPREGVLFVTSDEVTAPLWGFRRARNRAFEREVRRAIARGAPIGEGPVASPCRLTCVRTPAWKYARYDERERELYDLARDPLERDNLLAAGKPASPAVDARAAELDAMLGRYRALFA